MTVNDQERTKGEDITVDQILDLMKQRANTPFDQQLVDFFRDVLEEHTPGKGSDNCPTCYYGNMEWPCTPWLQIDNATRQWLIDEYLAVTTGSQRPGQFESLNTDGARS